MKAIDSHAHIIADAGESLAALKKGGVKLLNIALAADNRGEWRKRNSGAAERYRALAEKWPETFAWCTSFDTPRFDDPDYAGRAISELDRDFAAGAVACKVWKRIGMEIRKPSGEYLQIDDPVFEPIFRHIEKAGRTVIMHIGEPLACWQPLTEDNLHAEYYREHPGDYMYDKKGAPSHADIMAARDRVLEKHPKLRVVGAHLGSLEYDTDEVAKRLEKYPNFAVDSSARLLDLAVQDKDKVRDFFIRYADRLLFGTDLGGGTPHSAMDAGRLANQLKYMEKRYEGEFSYYESKGEVEIEWWGPTHRLQGLGLPWDVLGKFYLENARRWIPGA